MSRTNGRKIGSTSNDDFEKLNQSGQLMKFLDGEFELFERALEDDRRFCEKEIDSTRVHLKKLEEKLIQKINEMRHDLDKLKRKNEEVYQGNKQVYDEESRKIDELSKSGRHRDAWNQYQRYKETFNQREKVIEQIPTVPITESSIDDLFSMQTKPKETPVVSPPATASPTIISKTTMNFASDDDDNDESKLTKKERLRRSKKVEKTDMTKDTDQDQASEHEDDAKTMQTFASRSIVCPGLPESSSSMMTKSIKPGFSFSNRLKQSSQSSTVTTIPPSLSPSNIDRPSVNFHLDLNVFRQLTVDPILDYAHDKNVFLLIAATARHITLFKSQFGRVDRWQLGLIDRSTQQTKMLTWNDGLITSMGCIDNSRLFIFTERDFIQFNPEANRKIQSQILPRGDDDVDHGTSENPYEDLKRGIGTVFDGFFYHLYSNRKSNRVLSKSKLANMLHIFDYPVSQHIDDVYQWIHLNINRHSINFLVQLDDGNFAVLFCSLKDVSERKRVLLSDAEDPLSIHSVFIPNENNYVYFVNDRSKRVIHILNQDSYLDSYPTSAHAIYYVEERNQLLIVGDKMISSMNLNSLFSS